MAIQANDLLIDISEWQGNPDFAKVKAGCAAVIARVQAGSTHPDPRYASDIAGCKQYGIPYSTYAYAKYISVADAIKEADDAYSRMDKDSKVFMLDIEENCCMVALDIVKAGQAYVDRLRTNGFKGKIMVYSYDQFFTQWGLGAIKCDGHWMAAYGCDDGNPHVKPINPADLWQFTSVGHIDGIAGNVDESILTGTVPMAWFTDIPVHVEVKPIMCVRVISQTDVRSEPSHSSGYIGDVVPPSMYNVWKRSGDFHYIIFDSVKNICGWVDGNGGKNLYWLDNPALQQHTPTTYAVVAGDYVSKIAAKYNVSIQQIKLWNALDANYDIRVGQILKVSA